MRKAFSLIWTALVGLFRSRASLAAEILVLRHQINVLRRNSPKRQTFSVTDRLIFAGLYRLAATVLNALAIVKPETVIKWHSAGFRSYWRWKEARWRPPNRTAKGTLPVSAVAPRSRAITYKAGGPRPARRQTCAFCGFRLKF